MSSNNCLSERELEVLQLVATGLTDKQVAKQLQLSHKTVRNHMDLTRAKLGAKTRGAAIAIALQRGIITPGEPEDEGKT
jgi:DNA-binding CsgD family transcriptional regulator